MNIKKYLIGICFIILIIPIWAKHAIYSNNNYDIVLDYNETAYPGDAIFIRMILSPKGKLRSQKTKKTNAIVKLEYKKKITDSCKFFSKKAKDRHDAELIAGIPIPTWFEKGEYTLVVEFTPFGQDVQEFSLPFALKNKKFKEETITLDKKNATIKSDLSQTRLDQIEKLQKILGTVNSEIYTLEPFILPVNLNKRTAYFGDLRTYKYETGKTTKDIHTGIDFGVAKGTKVSACGNGKVVMAENRISTGWTIIIEHAPGLYSLYYHLSSLSVKVGNKVKQGEQIGLSGATGLATGPHLHWEIRLNKAAVNPDFFRKDFAFENIQKQ